MHKLDRKPTDANDDLRQRSIQRELPEEWRTVNKGILPGVALTVNFFDFSELKVSESGTLTPIEFADIGTIFEQ